MMYTALTIAGSDSSGGAGIQADIKTMTANRVYAMSAITALTAQNTTGVTAILNATPEFLGQELDSVFTDIFPDAVKIGMVSERELICVIAEKLKQYQAKNIVVDPVMVATSGARLISEDAIDTLKQELFPLAAVLTPNIPEAEELTSMHIEHADDMIDIARQYYEAGSDIVLSNTFGANALKFHDSRHELDEIVKMVGMDALSAPDRLKMEASRSIREDYLHQNSFHEVDTYTSLRKQYMMMELVLGFYNKSMEALKQGASVDKLIKMPVREAIGRFKYTHEDRLDEAFNEIMDKLAEEVANTLEKEDF